MIQQVSLELSLQLKENGFQQDGLWWWIHISEIKNLMPDRWVLFGKDNSRLGDNRCVAPTVAELGEALPSNILQRAIGEGEHGGKYYLYTQKESGRGWTCFYAMNNGQARLYIEEANTEANARAKCWLYLKKNGLI